MTFHVKHTAQVQEGRNAYMDGPTPARLLTDRRDLPALERLHNALGTAAIHSFPTKACSHLWCSHLWIESFRR